MMFLLYFHVMISSSVQSIATVDMSSGKTFQKEYSPSRSTFLLVNQHLRRAKILKGKAIFKGKGQSLSFFKMKWCRSIGLRNLFVWYQTWSMIFFVNLFFSRGWSFKMESKVRNEHRNDETTLHGTDPSGQLYLHIVSIAEGDFFEGNGI
jgi:hypothetical protein